MDLETRQLLVCLVTAHVLGDFLLQSRRDVARKGRPLTLLKHTVIMAGLSYLLVGAWRVWQIPAWIFGTHAAIDWVKARVGKGGTAFLIDQAAHVAVLVFLSVGFGGLSLSLHWVEAGGATVLRGMILLSGLVIAVHAVGYLIGIAVQPLLEELARVDPPPTHDLQWEKRGFADGGLIIGRLERALIFLLVLINVPSGVGFLVAAKSIFRFGELRDHEHRMEAEYILIGTLMSFGGGLLVSVLTRWVLGMAWS